MVIPFEGLVSVVNDHIAHTPIARDQESWSMEQLPDHLENVVLNSIAIRSIMIIVMTFKGLGKRRKQPYRPHVQSSR